jgi:hypothetical protein
MIGILEKMMSDGPRRMRMEDDGTWQADDPELTEYLNAEYGPGEHHDHIRGDWRVASFHRVAESFGARVVQFDPPRAPTRDEHGNDIIH